MWVTAVRGGVGLNASGDVVGAEAKVKKRAKGSWRRARGAMEGQGLPDEDLGIMHTAAYFMHICWIAE